MGFELFFDVIFDEAKVGKMKKNSPDIVQTLHERGARYVVDVEQQPVAVLLSLTEYEHYLDLLDDEEDSQDPDLAMRLAQAADSPGPRKRLSFRDYLDQRQTVDEKVSC
ncbi:MAG: hypothetical protein ACP5J4_15770 [Anaerolineae bacterium]